VNLHEQRTERYDSYHRRFILGRPYLRNVLLVVNKARMQHTILVTSQGEILVWGYNESWTGPQDHPPHERFKSDQRTRKPTCSYFFCAGEYAHAVFDPKW
jgi:hypothetical protein